MTLYALGTNTNQVYNLTAWETLPYPSIEVHDFEHTSRHKGGIGQMVISKDEELYCENCRYMIMIMSDQDDTLEVTVRKRMLNILMRLEDGTEQFGVLKQNENDAFRLLIPPWRAGAGIELQVLAGNITLEYSEDPSFPIETTNRIKQWQPLEYFNVHINHLSGDNPFQYRNSYIRVIGQNLINKYILNYVEDNHVMEIVPSIARKGYLSSGYSKTYYLKG